jgi:hypothetical protein
MSSSTRLGGRQLIPRPLTVHRSKIIRTARSHNSTWTYEPYARRGNHRFQPVFGANSSSSCSTRSAAGRPAPRAEPDGCAGHEPQCHRVPSHPLCGLAHNGDRVPHNLRRGLAARDPPITQPSRATDAAGVRGEEREPALRPGGPREPRCPESPTSPTLARQIRSARSYPREVAVDEVELAQRSQQRRVLLQPAPGPWTPR